MWHALIRCLLLVKKPAFTCLTSLHCMTTNDTKLRNQARPIVQSNGSDKQVWTALLSKVQVDSSTAKMNTRNGEWLCKRRYLWGCIFWTTHITFLLCRLWNWLKLCSFWVFRTADEISLSFSLVLLYTQYMASLQEVPLERTAMIHVIDIYALHHSLERSKTLLITPSCRVKRVVTSHPTILFATKFLPFPPLLPQLSSYAHTSQLCSAASAHHLTHLEMEQTHCSKRSLHQLNLQP